MSLYEYTDMTGCVVQVETLDWLEDGYHYEGDERLPCSRYCIGYDEEGDGLSIWLDDDFREVDA